MPIAGPTRTAPHRPGHLEAGVLLVGAGALVLFISLFLEWYQPGASAWEVFEAWDLVLAALAAVAIAASAGRLGYAPARPASWLAGPAIAALVIVLYVIVDPPPVVGGLPDGDPGTGLWLALAASALMAAGAMLSVARISIAINPVGRRDAVPAAAHDPAMAPAGRPVAGEPAGVADPRTPAVPATVAPDRTEPTRRV